MSTLVRILIDENLPPSLKIHLADLFPGSVHVRDIGLANSPDSSVWEYAASRELTILTKDRDFAQDGAVEKNWTADRDPNTCRKLLSLHAGSPNQGKRATNQRSDPEKGIAAQHWLIP